MGARGATEGAQQWQEEPRLLWQMLSFLSLWRQLLRGQGGSFGGNGNGHRINMPVTEPHQPRVYRVDFNLVALPGLSPGSLVWSST